jgi:putative spermidine/putrescine transport system substrate-binding protein
MAPTPAASTTASSAAEGDPACGDTLRDIAAKAKGEGALTVIALPPDWANYAAVIESFRDTYDITVTDLDPEASSAEEIAAVRSMAGKPDRPDVVDLGSPFTQRAISEGILAPYRTLNWPQIPDDMKSAAGDWVAAYYGIMSLAVDTRVQPVIPATWAELKDPRYKNQVAMISDPRSSGTAFGAVVAAALAFGGSLENVLPGIRYFADLKRLGTLRPKSSAAKAPITIDWSFNFGRAGYGTGSSAFKTVIPRDGQYAAFYTQSVVAGAAHPCAARLWLEHITSDVGAMGYLNGLAIPARVAALEAYGLVRPTLRTRLPSPAQLNDAVMSDPVKLVKAKAQVDASWGPLVLGEK